MLDPQFVRNQLDDVAKKLATRGLTLDTASLTDLENQRKLCQVKTQELQSERNRLSKEIGQLKAKGLDTAPTMAQVANLGEQLQASEAQLEQIQTQLNHILLTLPNLPHDSVPVGRSEEDNLEIRRWGEPKVLDFTVKDHVDLGAQLQMLDFEVAAKITGARFAVMRGGIGALTPGIDSIYARFAQSRTWLYGGLCPVHGQCRQFARYGATS